MPQSREQLIASIERRLSGVDVWLAEVEAASTRAKTSVRMELERRLDDLHERRNELTERLRDLEQSGSEPSERLTSRVKEADRRLVSAMDDLQSLVGTPP